MTNEEVPIFTDLFGLEPELGYLCRLFGSLLKVRFVIEPISNLSSGISRPYILYAKWEERLEGYKTPYIYMLPDYSFWESYLQQKIPTLEYYDNDDILVINSQTYKNKFCNYNNFSITQFDFFASSFFLITRMDEVWMEQPKDKHGRCQFKNSFFNEKSILKPLINEYALSLKKAMEDIWKIVIPLRSDNFSAVITHDVDIPYYYKTFGPELSRIYHSLRGRGTYKSFRDVMQLAKTILGLSSDPFDTYEYIRTVETSQNVPSTWFILMSRDNRWGLNKRKYSRRLQWLASQGCEIGIHPGYHSAFSIQDIRKETQAVEQLSKTKIKGVRNHFLKFSVPESYWNYAELGFKYDTSLGYAEQEGFRAGIAAPFKPFDVVQRKMIDILEIPLIVMDGVLRDYRGMSPDEALNSIKQLVDIVKINSGVIVFNWHNTFFVNSVDDWRSVFEESINYMVQEDACFWDCLSLSNIWIKHWE